MFCITFSSTASTFICRQGWKDVYLAIRYCWWLSWSYTHLAKPEQSTTFTERLHDLALRKDICFYDVRNIFRCRWLNHFLSILCTNIDIILGFRWHHNQCFSNTDVLQVVDVFGTLSGTMKYYCGPFGTLKVIGNRNCLKLCFNMMLDLAAGYRRIVEHKTQCTIPAQRTARKQL